jgi:hypothetical protein
LIETTQPVYLATYTASVVVRLRSEEGRREWRRLLECSDFDHRSAWRQYVARVCPTCPANYLDDVIDSARSALLIDRPQRIRRVRRIAA